MTKALETQKAPIALIYAMWQRNTNRLKFTRDGRNLILELKLLGGDQDAGGQMLYAMPTWQDTSQYTT